MFVLLWKLLPKQDSGSVDCNLGSVNFSSHEKSLDLILPFTRPSLLSYQLHQCRKSLSELLPHQTQLPKHINIIQMYFSKKITEGRNTHSQWFYKKHMNRTYRKESIQYWFHIFANITSLQGTISCIRAFMKNSPYHSLMQE